MPVATVHFPVPGTEQGRHHLWDILAKNAEPQLNVTKPSVES